MGIVVFAAPVSGIRGKVGGNIYSANKSGAYIKAWGRGSNPRTQTQTTHRAALVRFAQAWASITTAQQADWDTYAALAAQDKTNSLGETYSASGFNWFVELSLNLHSAGASQIDSAPVLGTPAAPGIASFIMHKTSGAGNSQWRIDIGDPNLGAFHVVKAAIKNTLGNLAIPDVRTYMTTAIPDGNRKIFFQTELEAHFGTIQVGQQGFSTIAVQNAEGRRGPIEAQTTPIVA